MKDILLSGPGKNALSTALMQGVIAELDKARGEPIFLRGDGDAFSAGLNLKEVSGLDVAGMTTFLGALEDLVKALYEYPAPVVAWVNGHAIAGGCVVALAADVRVMTAKDGARIGLNEVALGLRFPPVTLAMIRARLTAPALERVLLEAALYDANEARAIGLVDAIGEEEEARLLAAKMAAHPRDVFASTKAMLRPRLVPSDAERRAFVDETIPYWASPERRAALRDVLERAKRKA
jgi:enoyl-CoA hydratase/carnithine racemase